MAKILSVKKRSAFGRMVGGVHQWKVEVEHNGKIKKLNAWAGINTPAVNSLLYSIDEQLGTHLMYEYVIGNRANVEGVEHAELAIEGKVNIQTKTKSKKIVIHVGR